jgi:very-short-patch-repair endonuclease
MRARELRRFSPEAERALWHRLRNRQLGGFKFRRQHPVGPFFADFACIEAKLIVEIDGSQHLEPAAVEADARRTEVLSRCDFYVLRFDSRQALIETDGVAQILDWLESHHPHPNPLPLAGEGASKD